MASGTDVLSRRERVVLAEDLSGVAEGTAGEVILHTGLNWLRYWVRFDSGAERGSIHRAKLVREARWEDFLVERAEAEAAAEAGQIAGTESGEAEEAPAADGGGGGEEVVVGGVTVPPHLLA